MKGVVLLVLLAFVAASVGQRLIKGSREFAPADWNVRGYVALPLLFSYLSQQSERQCPNQIFSSASPLQRRRVL